MAPMANVVSDVLMGVKGINNLLFLAVLLLSMSLTHHALLVVVEGAKSLSPEEDFELERQLQILNKHPVKTIYTDWGDIIDCIDIHKQPAFDNPLLKDHKIQMKPTSFPNMNGDETLSTTRHKPSILKASVKCPEGTVPIRRTQKDDLTSAEPPKANFDRNGSSNSMSQYIAGFLYQTVGEAVYGVSASINVYNPDMVATDQFSAAEIMVAAGPFTEMNAIYAGWMVQQNLYGNNDTRLFAFTTIDGGKTGCYNTLCPGFVQVDPSFTPSTPLLDKYSTYGGIQHTIDVKIYQDRATKNWWLIYEKNISIGYWPNSLFPLFTAGGSYLYWGGNVMNGGGDQKRAPRMGSGRFPDGDYQHACYFEHIQYIDADNKPVDPQDDKMKEISHQCGEWYRVKYFGLSKKGRGHTFQFGGPGGICY